MRKGQSHAAKTREKIQTSMLINRLEDHIVGKLELTATQLRAIEILLKKSLPDLSNVQLSGDEDNPIKSVSEIVLKAMDVSS